jgi:hypothetical protein
VHSLWVNSWLIVVQLTDPSSFDEEAATLCSTTYALTRNAGWNTYHNAVAAIPHYSTTFVNVEKCYNDLLVIDSQGTSYYRLRSSYLEVYLVPPFVIYKPFTFTVRAESVSQDQSVICSAKLTYIGVPPLEQPILPGALKFPDSF